MEMNSTVVIIKQIEYLTIYNQYHTYLNIIINTYYNHYNRTITNIFILELKVLDLSFSLYPSVRIPTDGDEEGDADVNTSTNDPLLSIPPSLFSSFKNKVHRPYNIF